MTTVTREQVKQHLAAHDAIIIEALPEQYFAEGHLPGAIMMPEDQVKDLAPKLLKDKNQKIVTYCGGIKCTAAGKTAEALKSLGYKNVSEYSAGKADWKEAGLPLEKSGGGSCSSGVGKGEMKGSCGTSKSGSCG